MLSTPDYWKTWKGLIARIADIAHTFTWQTLNNTLREAVVVYNVTKPPAAPKRKLVWKTKSDIYGYYSKANPHGVCPICGYYEGTMYDADDPLLPNINPHVECRCWWEDAPEITVEI